MSLPPCPTIRFPDFAGEARPDQNSNIRTVEGLKIDANVGNFCALYSQSITCKQLIVSTSLIGSSSGSTGNLLGTTDLFPRGVVMPQAGNLNSLSASYTSVLAAGSITVNVYQNAIVAPVATVTIATGTNTVYITGLVVPYVAGDYLFMRAVPSVGPAPAPVAPTEIVTGTFWFN